jgi:hypothetical protein
VELIVLAPEAIQERIASTCSEDSAGRGVGGIRGCIGHRSTPSIITRRRCPPTLASQRLFPQPFDTQRRGMSA